MRQAGTTSKYVTKGALVYLEGSREIGQFIDKQGRERGLPRIMASDVQFLSSGRGTEAQESSPADPEEISAEDVPL